MVIVTGAAGRTGSEVVRLLAARGTRIRALVRHPEKAKGPSSPAVEIATGDLSRPATLDPIFRGAVKLFLVSSPDPDVGTLHGNAIEAAKRTGVQHIVRLSAYGANPQSSALLLRTHGEVDERLSRSGISFTILRSHAFFQNSLMYAQSVAADGAIYAPMRDGAMAMIDNRDVAAAAGAVLTGHGHSGRVYDLTGPEAITHARIAESLSAGLERPVRYVDVPAETARERMRGKMPDWLIDAYLELVSIWSTGKHADLSDAFQRITGKKPRPYDQFARDFAASFGKAEKSPAH